MSVTTLIPARTRRLAESALEAHRTNMQRIAGWVSAWVELHDIPEDDRMLVDLTFSVALQAAGDGPDAADRFIERLATEGIDLAVGMVG